MSPSSTKTRRQMKILELVREREIGSQEALASALEEFGLGVTQATLSRDLRELNIVRLPQATGYRYLPAGARERPQGFDTWTLARIAAAEVWQVASNEMVTVVRTQPGRAPGVAAYLDGLRLTEILATVAGDDTVLVMPRSINDNKNLEQRLAKLFELPAAEAPRQLENR